MSESEFEDDYFEDEYAETGAPPSTVTISRNGDIVRKNKDKFNRKRNKIKVRKTGPKENNFLQLGDLKDAEDNDNDNENQEGEGSGSSGSMPGLFGQNNKLDVNVHITKEHETKPPKETQKEKKERLKYHISKYTEQNRDIYFIKLVAGSLKRPFESLINIEDKREATRDMFGTVLTGQPPPKLDERVVINIKYIYGNELLFAWSTIIEKVKLMLSPYDSKISQWRTTEDVHLKLIENDTTCVSFSRYVAFIIMKESNNLIPRNRTRYVIDQDGVMEDRLAVDLMRAIHTEYSMLRDDLVNRFL